MSPTDARRMLSDTGAHVKSRRSFPRSEGAPLLHQSVLNHIGEALAEQARAAGQVAHVTVVDLFGLDGDGPFAISLQVGRPDVQSPHVMRLQVLNLLDREPAGL